MKKLYGVITAMTTPFTADGKVDTAALEEQTEYLIEKGIQCLYPCGTTGEMYLMSAEERELVAETVVKKAAGRVTVFIHVGAMTVDETIRLAQHAHKIGADGVGVVTPSYFTVNDRAMVEYYKTVCAALPDDFPVYVYVIPQLAHNDISAATMEQIAAPARMWWASSTASPICVASTNICKCEMETSLWCPARTTCSCLPWCAAATVLSPAAPAHSPKPL